MRNLTGVSTIACQRCRLRKTKCDRNLPKCKSCERANAPCLTTDPTSGRAVPRSYLSHLESRVKELEEELAKRDGNNLDLGQVDGGSYLGASSGLTFSSIIGAALKENLPNTQTVQTTPRTVPEMSADMVLPTKPVAEQYLSVFFHEANPQMPILHREAFIRTHFEPIYGKLSPTTNLATNSTSPALDTGLEEPPPGTHYRLCVDTGSYAFPSLAIRRSLYFLYSVFAIGVASYQQEYDEKLAESLHLTAMKYYRLVLSSPDRLEALQGVLLLALYSVMRPAYPGIWHVVGTAMRMCQELGLHNERRNSSVDPATQDFCRRLFWCAYSLDRQISVYLGRPPGIPDYCIRTPYPSLLDDSVVPYKLGHEVEQKPPFPPVKFPPPQETFSPSYKRISLAIFRLRRLQGEIQAVLYDGREVPRSFSDIAQWREFILNKLEMWWQDISTKPELNNCEFNVNYLVLNYHQTRILLFGVSPGNPRPSEGHMLIIAHAGLQIIHTYSDIFGSKSLNYSWAAVHNIFLAGTSYLYVLYHSESFRAKTSITELETVVISALEVMDALKKYCDAAITCHRSFKLLSQAVIELVRRDKILDNGQSPSAYSDAGDDSIVSFLNNAAADASVGVGGLNFAGSNPLTPLLSQSDLSTPSMGPNSQMSTPMFQSQGNMLGPASPMRLNNNTLTEVSTTPAPEVYKPFSPPAQPPQPGQNASLKSERALDQVTAPLGDDNDLYVYDFLNEMQQSLIWNNFLNQSSTLPQSASQQQNSEHDQVPFY